MGRIPQQIIDDVRSQTDIVQVVQQYVGLKRAGTNNHKGLCPFHDEKTPSFNVNAGKGMYKCFGCGAGGDAIKFLIKLEGWSFAETIRHLAGRLGIEVPEETPEETQKARARSEARSLYTTLMDTARAYYEECLWGEGGEKARTYLDERGIDPETARAFGMGYAPPGWQNLLDVLRVKRIQGALVERAGMAISRNQGNGFYDRFRDRMVFPVIDVWGHTLAFGGRVLPGDDGPKYINSAETRFYTKGKHLFGLSNAKKGIGRAGYALLVEGNFDVITLHAQGIEMTVAPMGTAFTEDQARLLKRYTRDVVIAFDGDDAGEQATLKCLSVMERAGLEARVVRFDAKDDPDTFVRREGPQALFEKIEQAQPLIGWALDRELPLSPDGPIEDRLRALERAATIMGEIRSKITWKYYAEDLKRRLDIEPRQLSNYLRKPEQVVDEVKTKWSERPDETGMELDRNEFTLLVLLLDHPEWLESFERESLGNLLESKELAGFLTQAEAYYASNTRLDLPILFEAIDPPAFGSVLTHAATMVGQTYDEDKAGQMYADTLRQIKVCWAERSLDELLKTQDTLNFTTQRDDWVAITRQIEQFQQFRDAHKSA